jgi:hypothetical protein
MSLPSQESKDLRKITPSVFKDVYDFQVRESFLGQLTPIARIR